MKKMIPLCLLTAEIVKTILISATYADSVVILALAALNIAIEYLDNNKKYEELQEQISKIQQKNEKDLEEFKEIKTYVSSLRLASGAFTKRDK